MDFLIILFVVVSYISLFLLIKRLNKDMQELKTIRVIPTKDGPRLVKLEPGKKLKPKCHSNLYQLERERDSIKEEGWPS